MHGSLRSMIACVALGALACGQQRTPAAPGTFDDFEEENVTVIGGEAGSSATGDARVTVSTPEGAVQCVEVSDNLCVPVDETNSQWCERDGGPVDVVVVDGEVVEVICYPPPDNGGQPEEVVGTDHEGDIEVLQNGNNTAITFSEETNGVPIEGNLDVQGNNVSIYGNGPDETIIDGDVILSGNNVRLRGVTITGTLDLSRNNVSVVLCRILGDVVLSTASTNGSVFVENDVFGAFIADSNNNLFTGNDVQGAWTVTGHNDLCDANHAFLDANANQLVEDAERGAEVLTCP